MMSMLLLLPPVLGGLSNLACQILLCRSKTTGLLASIFAGFGLGLAVTVVSHLLLVDPLAWDGAVANGLIYGCGGYTYFHLLNMGETARRIRLLRELTQAGAHGLSAQDLALRYNSREMLARRLERLLTQGIVRDVDGRLYLVKRGALVMTGMVGLFKRLVLGREFSQRP